MNAGMSSVARRIAAAVLLGVACERTADRLQSRQDEESLARGVDTRVSTFKDPEPPRTSPPPGPLPTALPSPPIDPAAPALEISGRTRPEALAGLRFRVPVEWTQSTDPSKEHLTFTIPGPAGSGELVVYRFGDDAGEAEFRRWRAGVLEIARTAGRGDAQAMVRGPLQITMIDVPGAIADRVRPAAAGVPRSAGDRLLGAIVEGDDVRYFFAFTGPAATVALWEQGFADFAVSFAVDPLP